MTSGSGPSTPTRAPAGQFNPDSFSTPTKSAPQHSSRFIEALGKMFQRVDAEQLLHAIDNVTGDQHSYTITGSTALYLHALSKETLNGRLPLPEIPLPDLALPADIDLLAQPSAIRLVETASTADLRTLKLDRQPGSSHVLLMKAQSTILDSQISQGGQSQQAGESSPVDNSRAIKIDFIPADQREFRHQATRTSLVFGQRVADPETILSHYRIRAQDEDFIHQCGGEAQARAKVNPWIQYFKPAQAEAGSSGTESSRPVNADQQAISFPAGVQAGVRPGRSSRPARVLFQTASQASSDNTSGNEQLN